MSNVLLTIQWALLASGFVGAVPLWLLVSPEAGLGSLILAMLSLVALKLEAIAFLPRR
jgi:hypothetical protein